MVYLSINMPFSLSLLSHQKRDKSLEYNKMVLVSVT
jgi:hypothetical protein